MKQKILRPLSTFICGLISTCNAIMLFRNRKRIF